MTDFGANRSYAGCGGGKTLDADLLGGNVTGPTAPGGLPPESDGVERAMFTRPSICSRRRVSPLSPATWAAVPVIASTAAIGSGNDSPTLDLCNPLDRSRDWRGEAVFRDLL